MLKNKLLTDNYLESLIGPIFCPVASQLGMRKTFDSSAYLYTFC